MAPQKYRIFTFFLLVLSGLQFKIRVTVSSNEKGDATTLSSSTLSPQVFFRTVKGWGRVHVVFWSIRPRRHDDITERRMTSCWCGREVSNLTQWKIKSTRRCQHTYFKLLSRHRARNRCLTVLTVAGEKKKNKGRGGWGWPFMQGRSSRTQQGKS